MHSDRVSMHAIVWQVSRRYGLIVNLLVWHGSHAFAMASWSSSMRMGVVEAYVEHDMTVTRTSRH
jgi:hypothetical protein